MTCDLEILFHTYQVLYRISVTTRSLKCHVLTPGILWHLWMRRSPLSAFGQVRFMGDCYCPCRWLSGEKESCFREQILWTWEPYLIKVRHIVLQFHLVETFRGLLVLEKTWLLKVQLIHCQLLVRWPRRVSTLTNCSKGCPLRNYLSVVSSEAM